MIRMDSTNFARGKNDHVGSFCFKKIKHGGLIAEVQLVSIPDEEILDALLGKITMHRGTNHPVVSSDKDLFGSQFSHRLENQMRFRLLFERWIHSMLTGTDCRFGIANMSDFDVVVTINYGVFLLDWRGLRPPR